MSIIKNYGFLWERKYIYRGAGGAGNAGHLLGSVRVNGGVRVDFREQIGVYVLYDHNQKIVYVGQAGNGHADLFRRLGHHMIDDLRARWEYFSWIGFRGVNANGTLSNHQKVDAQVTNYRYKDALNEIEGILIEVIEPKLNKQSGRLKEAQEYFQVVDAKMTEASIYDLRNDIEAMRIELNKLS